MRSRLGGVRTYTVLALFGAISGIFFNQGYELFAYIMFFAVFLLVLAAYVLNIKFNKAFGMTTELAILIGVLLGFASTAAIIPIQILIIIIVMLTFILSQKHGVNTIVRRIAHAELSDVVSFGIVALVIFPFLPNQDFYISDWPGMADFLLSLGITDPVLSKLILFNPYKLWQYVVLISGFNLLGYFANKFFGKAKGLMLTGVFGGFISSTSTTIALAIRSKKSTSADIQSDLAGAALLATAVSFAQIMVLAASASLVFFSGILPATVAMALGSGLIGLFYLYRQQNIPQQVEVDLKPFSLLPAIKFVVLLMIIRILLQLASMYLGDGAFIFLTAASGLLGLDMAIISLGELLGQGKITLFVAILTFVLTNGVNFAAKAVYSRLQGSKHFAAIVQIGMLISLVAGIVVGAITLVGS
jgi:uncharacterized membrane protein (DUF4010 family)